MHIWGIYLEASEAESEHSSSTQCSLEPSPLTMGEVDTSFLQNMTRDLHLVNQYIQDFSFVKDFLRTTHSENLFLELSCSEIPHTLLPL